MVACCCDGVSFFFFAADDSEVYFLRYLKEPIRQRQVGLNQDGRHIENSSSLPGEGN